MTFGEDFRDMMPDTATWRAVLTRDDYGKVTEYASDVEIANCRLFRSHKMVRDVQGDEVVSTAQLWIADVLQIEPDDQVELSNGLTPSIITVDRPQDENGESHTKVYFR